MNALKNKNQAITHYEFTQMDSIEIDRNSAKITTIKKQCSSLLSQAKLTLCVTGGLLLWMAVVVPSTPILQLKRHITRTDMCAKKKH